MSSHSLTRRLTRSLSKANSMCLEEHNTRSNGPIHGHQAATMRPTADFPDFSLQFDRTRHGPDRGSPEYYIKMASHQQLLEAGNEAHSDLFDGFNKVNAKYQEVRALYTELMGKFKSVLEAPQPALSPPPPSGTASASSNTATLTMNPTSTKPKKADHPNVKFWSQRDYAKYSKEKKKKEGVVNPSGGKRRRGGAQLAETGENVATDYIEDEEGKIVGGDTAKNIRNRMRSIFKEMRKPENVYSLPLKWKDAGVTERKYVLQEMYLDYPYLRSCDDDWKVLYLASSVLSSFHNSLKRKVKKEANTTASDGQQEDNSTPDPSLIDVEIDTTAGSKRKASAKPLTSRPAKRSKASNENQAVPSSPSAAGSSPSTDAQIDPSLLSPSSEPTLTPEPTAENDATVAAPPPPISTTIPALSPEAAVPSFPSNSTAVDSATTVPSAASAPTPLPRPKPKLRSKKVLEDVTPTIPQLSADSRAPMQVDDGHQTLTGSTDEREPSVKDAIALVNPLNSLFGPPSGPSARLDGLRDPKEQASGLNNAQEPAGTQAVFAPGMKRPTGSLAPKNLCYIDFLKKSDPITPNAFDAYWKALSKDEQKKWNALSKEKKEGPREAEQAE